MTLECAIPPVPPPEKIQWFHNEVELFISPQLNMSYANGVCTLTIERVTPAMHGRYVCTVIIKGLAGSTEMELEVFGKPVSGRWRVLADFHFQFSTFQIRHFIFKILML